MIKPRRMCNSVAEAGITAILIGIAINTDMQHYRTQRLAELNYVTSLEQRETHELLQTMERTGLTGRNSHSVKEELNDIRQWHIDHTYKGDSALASSNSTQNKFSESAAANVYYLMSSLLEQSSTLFHDKSDQILPPNLS
jgi:hypothetical protein